jgi:murein DD-endopeptidase MepM/ murein hydrolase activator NlpD
MVLETGSGKERGNYIDYLTDSGFIVRYSHLKVRPKFKIGECLSEAQKVGEVGRTGTVTGPHLDIKIQELLGKQEFIDPWRIIGTSGILDKKGNIDFSLY